MSIYATNRLASIAEDSEISQEIMEAFADKTRETAHITNYGIIAQIHENDMRMFDAIISSDFAAVSSKNILEAAEFTALNEKMNNATAEKIWNKIVELVTALRDAIVKVARLFRDKISDLVKADKKIVERYTKPIEGLDNGFSLKVKFALPKKSLDSLAREATKSYSDIIRNVGRISSIASNIEADDASADSSIQDYRENINEINGNLVKSIEDIFTEGESTITKSIAEDAVLELMSGKAVVKAAKENADKAMKAIKELEKIIKSAKSKHAANPKVGAQVYSMASGIGTVTNKTMNTVNTALTKILAANRKIVLAAGRSALNGVKNEAVLNALFTSSDFYVAEMCEMV